jgi:cytochrome c
MKRKLFPALAMAGVFVAGGSIIHPFGNIDSRSAKTPILSGSQIDPVTLGLIRRACQNCHSANTELPLYGRIAPMSWLMARDVQQARLHMNLSQWAEYSAEERIILLSEIGGAVKSRDMPVRRYALLHGEARLSDEERERIYGWTRTERKLLMSSQSFIAPLSQHR